jgi:hypothetical protein
MNLQVEALVSYCDIERGERYHVQAIACCAETGQILIQVRGHWIDIVAFKPAPPSADAPEPAPPGDFRTLLNRER